MAWCSQNNSQRDAAKRLHANERRRSPSTSTHPAPALPASAAHRRSPPAAQAASGGMKACSAAAALLALVLFTALAERTAAQGSCGELTGDDWCTACELHPESQPDFSVYRCTECREGVPIIDDPDLTDAGQWVSGGVVWSQSVCAATWGPTPSSALGSACHAPTLPHPAVRHVRPAATALRRAGDVRSGPCDAAGAVQPRGSHQVRLLPGRLPARQRRRESSSWAPRRPCLARPDCWAGRALRRWPHRPSTHRWSLPPALQCVQACTATQTAAGCAACKLGRCSSCKAGYSFVEMGSKVQTSCSPLSRPAQRACTHWGLPAPKARRSPTRACPPPPQCVKCSVEHCASCADSDPLWCDQCEDGFFPAFDAATNSPVVRAAVVHGGQRRPGGHAPPPPPCRPCAAMPGPVLIRRSPGPAALLPPSHHPSAPSASPGWGSSLSRRAASACATPPWE